MRPIQSRDGTPHWSNDVISYPIIAALRNGLSLLNDIVRRFPAAKFLYGSLALLVVVTVATTIVEPEQGIIAGVAVIIFGVVVTVVGSATGKRSSATEYAARSLILGSTALVLVWAVALSIVYLVPRLRDAVNPPLQYKALPRPSSEQTQPGDAGVPKLIEDNHLVRLTFFRLGGIAVDQFLAGELKIGNETGTPTIAIKTDSFLKLKHLYDQIEKVVWPDYEDDDVADHGVDPHTFKTINETAGIKNILESAGQVKAIDEERAKQLVRDGTWSARVMSDGRAAFWRDSPRSLLKELGLPLFAQMIDQEPPEGFIPVLLHGEPGANGCPGRARQIVLETLPTRLVLEVALLENISSGSVAVGDFWTNEVKEDSLRSAGKAVASQHETRSWYPPKQLAAGERIGVILRVLLTTSAVDVERSGFAEIQEATAPQPGSTLVLLPPQPELNSADFGPPPNAKEKAFNLREIKTQALFRNASLPQMSREFVYGPEISIDAIEISGERYKVRPQGKEDAFVYARVGGASCPFVFTRESLMQKWILEEPILKNRIGFQGAGSESIPLRRFDGTLLVREVESETSYIDEVFVEVGPPGSRTVLRPNNRRLRSRDGSYVVLTKGESILVEFSVGGQNPTLSAYGYYVPNRSSPMLGVHTKRPNKTLLPTTPARDHLTAETRPTREMP